MTLKNCEANKKRKLSAEDAVAGVKVEGDEDEHDTTSAHNTQEGNMSIRLSHVDPQVFELFMKYVYMGSLPSSVDYVGTHAKQHAAPFASSKVQSPMPTAKGSMAPPAVPTPRMPGTMYAAAQQAVPPSVTAWLLGAKLNAMHFMNHAMMHIYSSLGKNFSLTPALIHFIWQRTNPTWALRNFINHVLVVYWADVEPGPSSLCPRIDRHPALDESWMQLFNEYADLRATIVLGVRGKRHMPSCEVYYVQSQMLPGPVVQKNRDAESTCGQQTRANMEKSKVEALNKSDAVEVSDSKARESEESVSTKLANNTTKEVSNEEASARRES